MEPNAVVWIDIGGGALARAERVDGSAVLTDANGNADCCCGGCEPGTPPCCCTVPPSCADPNLCNPAPPPVPCNCGPGYLTSGAPKWAIVSATFNYNFTRTAACGPNNANSATSLSGSGSNTVTYSLSTQASCQLGPPGNTFEVTGTLNGVRCNGQSFTQNFTLVVSGAVGGSSSGGPIATMQIDGLPGGQALCGSPFGTCNNVSGSIFSRTSSLSPVFSDSTVIGYSATTTYTQSDDIGNTSIVVTVNMLTGPWYPCPNDGGGDEPVRAALPRPVSAPADAPAQGPCSGCGDRVLTG